MMRSRGFVTRCEERLREGEPGVGLIEAQARSAELRTASVSNRTAASGGASTASAAAAISESVHVNSAV